MEEKQTKNPKTTVRIGKFAIIGVILALSNYVIYTFLANVIFNNPDLLWLSSLISTTIATFLAYLLHSKITWKERDVTKSAKYKFFIWNLLLAIVIVPPLTQLFSLITPLYDLAFNISQDLGLPFDYEFIQSTGAFCLTTAVTMVLNYIFYDKFVFGTKPKKEPKKEFNAEV